MKLKIFLALMVTASVAGAQTTLDSVVKLPGVSLLRDELSELANYKTRASIEAMIYGSFLLYGLDPKGAKTTESLQIVYFRVSKEIEKYPDLKCLWGWWLVSVANRVVPPDNTKVLKREKVRTKEGGVLEVELHEVVGDTSSVKLGKALITQSLKTRPDGFWERLWAFQTKPTDALSKKLEQMSAEMEGAYRWIIWSSLARNSPDSVVRSRFGKLRATIPPNTVYGQLVRREDAKVGR